MSSKKRSSKKQPTTPDATGKTTATKVAMLIAQQDRRKRSTKKLEREMKIIERNFAIDAKDKRKVLVVAALMKACEKMKAGKSYTEVVEALDAFCDIPIVKKLVDDLNIEDEDEITEDQWRNLCKDALAALFKDQDIPTLADQALERLPNRRTGAHLDTFSGMYMKAIAVVEWAHELYNNECSKTWYHTRNRSFIDKLNCHWVTMDYLPKLSVGTPFDDLLSWIEVAADKQDLDVNESIPKGTVLGAAKPSLANLVTTEGTQFNAESLTMLAREGMMNDLEARLKHEREGMMDSLEDRFKRERENERAEKRRYDRERYERDDRDVDRDRYDKRQKLHCDNCAKFKPHAAHTHNTGNCWNKPVDPRTPRGGRSELACYNCGHTGHFARDCPKRRDHRGRGDRGYDDRRHNRGDRDKHGGQKNKQLNKRMETLSESVTTLQASMKTIGTNLESGLKNGLKQLSQELKNDSGEGGSKNE